MTKAKSALVGRWRIVEADLWDRDFLDLCGPATLVVGSEGHGEISFDAVQVGLDIAYNHDEIDFIWCGFDEMDEVQGSRSAELQDDGSLITDFVYHLGDEAVLKALRHPSPADC